MAATVQPIGGALGTDIEGVDFARKLWDEAFFAIKKAWSDHLILSFARDSRARPPPEQEPVLFSKGTNHGISFWWTQGKLGSRSWRFILL
jgi:hypothetical protein